MTSIVDYKSLLKRRKLITFFIPRLNGGGAQKVVVNLANELSLDQSFLVHVVVLKREGAFAYDLDNSIKVVELGSNRTIQSIPALVKYLKNYSPSVFCSSLNYANVCAVIGVILSGFNSSLVLREDSVVLPPSGNFFELAKKVLLLKLYRITYRRATKVVAISKDVEKSLVQFGIATQKNIVTVGNPIEMYSRPKSINFSIGSERPYLIAVGRLEPEKGFDLLIRAYSSINNEELDLVIIGEGGQKRLLQNIIDELDLQGKVHLLGFKNNPMDFVYGAKLFVLSSRFEGFGNVLVEALSTGVPVLSTACPGAPSDILNNGLLGHLVEPNDVQALAQGIEQALSNPRGTIQARKSRAFEFSSRNICKIYKDKVFL